MFAVFTKCKNKSEISGLNQGVCVQIREIFRESLAFQILFTDFWRSICQNHHNTKTKDRRMVLTAILCCRWCYGSTWLSQANSLVALICMAFSVLNIKEWFVDHFSADIFVFGGRLIFQPARSFHGLILHNVLRVVAQNLALQRTKEKLELISW